MGKSSSHTSLLILGAGGHALSVGDAALAAGLNLIGFFSPGCDATETVLGPVFSNLDKIDFRVTAIGLGIGANFSREVAAQAMTEKFPHSKIVSIFHPNAWISPNATIAPGAVVLAQAAVGPGSYVGYGALLNTGASLDHGSSLGDYASLGPGARTGGQVCIGERTMIGIGTAIAHNTHVGHDSVVGAQSLVNQNMGNNLVAFGIPARIVRTRLRDEPYY